MLPLSSTLETQIRALAKRSGVLALPIDDAPVFETSTPVDALRDMVHTVNGSLVIPVWSGASERTIWSSPEVNYLFRALHDSHHLETGYGFDLEGERALAEHACALIEGERDRSILWAEVWGQVRYQQENGRFPVDQRAFVCAYIVDSEKTLEQGRF